MKCCFFPFKAKSESQQEKSAPELKKQSSKSDNSAANKAIQSVGSVSSPRSIPELYKEKEHNLRVFSFSELRTATNDFNKLLKIGEGGFGNVYKGTIRPPNGEGDPIVVAIKKLNKHGLQGHKQWLAEVQFLGVVDHPNLVKLLGYCSVDGERGIQRLLVYEFMPNKSLEDHLFNRVPAILPWKTRLEIMLSAAQGLVYLHEELEVQVIYRDFKASNVLLDEDFKPKLSDFGLAREGPIGDRTHVSTAVVGTYGYAAPEYVETGRLTIKSDIYNFGVVLYEILTGRRTLERNRPLAEQKLLEWVKQYPSDSQRFSMIIDPKLRNQYSFSAARKIAKLADSCLDKNPKDRPSMSQVVESLKEAIADSEEGNSSESSASNPVVTSRKHSHQMGVTDTARKISHLPQPRDNSARV
ncbi:putative serine/threonine-protein kinase PBL19 [Camellia lanceoleosa]|uniref:Serine/threonine-protein kinase PBL19 n=1 Tax=Camellia lanceoleosa TaxID=1840588 RepID=A0ACC0FMC0_9ERIC|nr:putative serine/threonine-protein kinase PBL19 [Camellia lanceoleosa]